MEEGRNDRRHRDSVMVRLDHDTLGMVAYGCIVHYRREDGCSGALFAIVSPGWRLGLDPLRGVW
jgi:uncharacterized protein YuzB (UPF0349 family)